MKAVLVVSFGSSHQKGLQTLDLIIQDMQVSFHDRRIYTAFTSQTIRMLLKQKNKDVKSISQIMKHILDDGVDDVVIMPLFMIKGQSYWQMYHEAVTYQHRFKRFAIANILLATPDDYQAVVEAFSTYLESQKIYQAVIGMGHGSHLIVSQSYNLLNTLFQKETNHTIYLATLMSEPTLDEAIDNLQGRYQKVSLFPFMIVAGYHVIRDMQQIWRPKLEKAGFEVSLMQQSLGEILEIRKIFVNHAQRCTL